MISPASPSAPAPLPASHRSAANRSKKTPPGPQPKREAAAKALASSLNGNCGMDFYRAASSNSELSDTHRRLCTVAAIVIARTKRTEVAAVRIQVAKMAQEVLVGTKSINDVLARWFADDDVTLFTRKADLLTRVSSTKGLDSRVCDLAWCHLSTSCKLDATAIEIAKAWVSKLAAERPTEEGFNSDAETWWPDFSKPEPEPEPEAK